MTVNNNTPDIRFSGFSGNWVEKKIEGVLTEEKRNITLIDDESYELVTVKRRNQGVVSRGFLNGKDILVKNYFKVRAGDFLISKRQVIHGANGIVPSCLDKAIVSNEYLVIGDNKKIKTEFWALIARRPEMYEKFFLSSYGVDIEKMVFDVCDWKTRDVVIPGIDEQTAISDFFKYIDQNIALSRRKYKKTNMLKNAFLSKMFPQTGKNKPEIRLKGFSGDWVEKQLGEILLIRNTFVDSDNYIVDIELENIESQTGIITGDTSVRTQASSYFAKGDVLFGRLRPYLKKWWLADIDGVKSGEIWAFYSNDLRSEFIYSIVQTNTFMNATNVSSGSKMPRADWSSMSQATIRLPILKEEQTAIGQFFKQMDDTLALQAKQLEALETLKKALLAKMFV